MPIHGLDVAGPATKWRSGEAAEDDDERPVRRDRLELNAGTVLVPQELELRECIADFKLIRPAEACDGGDDDAAFVVRERLRVLEVARIEVRLRSVAFGHRAGLWR